MQGDRDIVVAAVKKFNGSNPTDRPVILAALSKLGTVSDRRMAGFSLRVFFLPIFSPPRLNLHSTPIHTLLTHTQWTTATGAGILHANSEKRP